MRAVRHYHAKGLLPEPERDHSGYRRYDAGTVVELIRIRTLAEAGVPLARVQELLQADEEDFAAAIADIDKRLSAEIRQLQRHRERIHRLAAGDSLALPPEIVEFLDQLRALGVDERIVQVERDGWIPLAAHSPERVPELVARKREQMSHPQLTDFYLTLGQALDGADNDPMLVEMVDRTAAYLTQLAVEQGEDDVARRHRAIACRAARRIGVRHRSAGPPTDRATELREAGPVGRSSRASSPSAPRTDAAVKNAPTQRNSGNLSLDQAPKHDSVPAQQRELGTESGAHRHQHPRASTRRPFGDRVAQYMQYR